MALVGTLARLVVSGASVALPQLWEAILAAERRKSLGRSRRRFRPRVWLLQYVAEINSGSVLKGAKDFRPFDGRKFLKRISQWPGHRSRNQVHPPLAILAQSFNHACGDVLLVENLQSALSDGRREARSKTTALSVVACFAAVHQRSPNHCPPGDACRGL